jgi:soluble lytic murein transglycosylase-like protein
MRASEFITEDSKPQIAYDEYARQMAEKYGIPPSMVLHAMKKETGHLVDDPAARATVRGPKTRSGERAVGVMQLMPIAAKDVGVKDRNDPYENIRGGTELLSKYYNRYNQDPKLALAAYNAGPTAVDKHGGVPPFKQTQNYVADYVHDEKTPEPADSSIMGKVSGYLNNLVKPKSTTSTKTDKSMDSDLPPSLY